MCKYLKVSHKVTTNYKYFKLEFDYRETSEIRSTFIGSPELHGTKFSCTFKEICGPPVFFGRFEPPNS